MSDSGILMICGVLLFVMDGMMGGCIVLLVRLLLREFFEVVLVG